MGGAAVGGWREPSIRDVAVETAMAGLGPEPRSWRSALTGSLSFVVLALVMPRVGSDFWQGYLGGLIVITLIFAYRAGRRQQALGRDALRIATAVVVSILGMVAIVMLFAAMSFLVGPAPEDSLFKVVLERFFPNPAVFSLVLFVGLAVVLVVLYPRTRSTREAAEAAFQHEVQVERAARAAAKGQEPIAQ